MQTVIRRLKNKNSAGFDLVSNKMIKALPSSFASTLVEGYNRLFSAAHWCQEWKQARTVCLNKADHPAPATTQLRLISLLPTFSKLYERLFMIRFKAWTERMNILPSQQSGSRTHLATTSRVNCLLEQLTQSLRYNTFTPVVYVDFLQAFDLLWQAGLVLKLSRLDCPAPYLCWIAKYFSNRSMTIDFNGCLSKQIEVKRGAPQGSVFGPKAYIIGHHDMPQIFRRPDESHAYVDDVGIIYPPSIYLKFREQINDVETRINEDMAALERYSKIWHQPVNPRKTELVVYHRTVQCPKIYAVLGGLTIKQSKSFKYLGFHLDGKLSFRNMVNAQMGKLRKARSKTLVRILSDSFHTQSISDCFRWESDRIESESMVGTFDLGYSILKYIHRPFPAAFQLKQRFFNTYIWPHLYVLSTIYCLLSLSAQKQLNAFYRRCLRLIYSVFQCSTADLHTSLQLPILEFKLKNGLIKRLKNIQAYEHDLVEQVLWDKNMSNILHQHYHVKPFLRGMPRGRPNKRISTLSDCTQQTFFDKLCTFTLGE